MEADPCFLTSVSCGTCGAHAAYLKTMGSPSTAMLKLEQQQMTPLQSAALRAKTAGTFSVGRVELAPQRVPCTMQGSLQPVVSVWSLHP